MSDLLQINENGIYCAAGDFYIDPWRPVKNAVITHAHADHSRWGNDYYYAQMDSEAVMKLRLGDDINLSTYEYNQEFEFKNVKVSLHPAGHTIGSAQVRVEYKGEVWVVTGDYKVDKDNITTPFEVIECNTFITECTFGLPIYKWRDNDTVFEEINNWWRRNNKKNITSILTCYAFGKAQRILANIDDSIGDIFLHGSIYNTTRALEATGISFPAYRKTNIEYKDEFPGSLVLTTSGSLGTSWKRRFKNYEVAGASGWMQVRGIRRRKALDKGFVLSDHADWDQLNEVVKKTKAENVITTHGYTKVFSRWLNENGIKSSELKTDFRSEEV